MPRETRRQRRDARRASGGAPAAAHVGRDGAASPDAPVDVVIVPVPAGRPRRGAFVQESWAELRKVDWPNRAQVIQGTVVVIIACAIVGAYLWGADEALRPVVRDVLLGQ